MPVHTYYASTAARNAAMNGTFNQMFVLIDTKTKMYKRYSGRTCVLKVQMAEHIDEYWVEKLRTNPEEVLPPEEPQLA